MRPQAKVRLVAMIASIAGIGLGVAVHFFPTWVTTRETYCARCALHQTDAETHSVFGRRRTSQTRGGVLHKLLAPAVGDHAHEWIEPASRAVQLTPAKHISSRDEFTRTVSESEVADLDALEESPHLLSLLDQAMRDDKARTLKLVSKVLDPKAFLGVEAIGLLDRPTSWEDRWQTVDAFLALYRCSASDVSVSCHMRNGPTDLMVLVRTATSVHQGGIDWPHWVPPGKTPPPGAGEPSGYAAVMLAD